MYSLDTLDIRLRKTATGRKVVDVVVLYSEEVAYLINHHRGVMVTWNRNHGPEFISNVLKSGFEKDYQLNKEINGISITTLIRRMGAVLQDAGSSELRKAVGQYFFLALKMANECSSLEEVIQRIERMDGLHPSSENEV